MRAARRLVGQYLSPATVDWTARTDPQDTDRDGKPDRWTVTDELNRTRWFGRDTDGDGEVDFAQADVGLDGEIDHSSVLVKGRWQATNLLDAWLEMNFAIPQHRSQYEPHDLDLIVNGKVVGQLKQTIPEGNYRFPLAPTALNWGGGENQLEINSHFRNFAHYAISSDFQLKTRLLATDAYAIGTSREDAVKRLFESDKDFSTDGPDYSISSEDLDLTPQRQAQAGLAGPHHRDGPQPGGRVERPAGGGPVPGRSRDRGQGADSSDHRLSGHDDRFALRVRLARGAGQSQPARRGRSGQSGRQNPTARTTRRSSASWSRGTMPRRC